MFKLCGTIIAVLLATLLATTSLGFAHGKCESLSALADQSTLFYSSEEIQRDLVPHLGNLIEATRIPPNEGLPRYLWASIQSLLDAVQGPKLVPFAAFYLLINRSMRTFCLKRRFLLLENELRLVDRLLAQNSVARQRALRIFTNWFFIMTEDSEKTTFAINYLLESALDPKSTEDVFLALEKKLKKNADEKRALSSVSRALRMILPALQKRIDIQFFILDDLSITQNTEFKFDSPFDLAHPDHKDKDRETLKKNYSKFFELAERLFRFENEQLKAFYERSSDSLKEGTDSNTILTMLRNRNEILSPAEILFFLKLVEQQPQSMHHTTLQQNVALLYELGAFLLKKNIASPSQNTADILLFFSIIQKTFPASLEAGQRQDLEKRFKERPLNALDAETRNKLFSVIVDDKWEELKSLLLYIQVNRIPLRSIRSTGGKTLAELARKTGNRRLARKITQHFPETESTAKLEK